MYIHTFKKHNNKNTFLKHILILLGQIPIEIMNLHMQFFFFSSAAAMRGITIRQ